MLQYLVSIRKDFQLAGLLFEAAMSFEVDVQALEDFIEQVRLVFLAQVSEIFLEILQLEIWLKEVIEIFRQDLLVEVDAALLLGNLFLIYFICYQIALINSLILQREPQFLQNGFSLLQFLVIVINITEGLVIQEEQVLAEPAANILQVLNLQLQILFSLLTLLL